MIKLPVSNCSYTLSCSACVHLRCHHLQAEAAAERETRAAEEAFCQSLMSSPADKQAVRPTSASASPAQRMYASLVLNVSATISLTCTLQARSGCTFYFTHCCVDAVS